MDSSGQGLIRDVWAENLEIEMERIRGLIGRYSYISMVNINLDFILVSLLTLLGHGISGSGCSSLGKLQESIRFFVPNFAL